MPHDPGNHFNCTHIAATLWSDTFAAEGASKTVRLKVPGMTASKGSSLDTHDQRVVLKSDGMASNWAQADPASDRSNKSSMICVLLAKTSISLTLPIRKRRCILIRCYGGCPSLRTSTVMTLDLPAAHPFVGIDRECPSRVGRCGECYGVSNEIYSQVGGNEGARRIFGSVHEGSQGAKLSEDSEEMILPRLRSPSLATCECSVMSEGSGIEQGSFENHVTTRFCL